MGNAELFHAVRGGFWLEISLPAKRSFDIAPASVRIWEGSGFSGVPSAKRCLRGVHTNFNFVQTFTVIDAHEQRSSCDN
jgi:hypothetical protein